MILRGNVFSRILEMDTGITVVIPNRFLSGKPYQVAYLLHGLCGDSNSWTDNTMLPVYANEQDILFIMPEVSRSLYSDMKYGQKFFTYITEELPVICKRVFNISTKREDTAIMGVSMGGYGALKCAFTKPEQYGYCFAFGAACLSIKEGLKAQRKYGQTPEFRQMYGEQLLLDFRSIFGDDLEWKPEYDIYELAKRITDSVLQPETYSFCGTNDPLKEDNIRLASFMKEQNFNFTYEEWKGGHDWIFFNETLKRALEILKEKRQKKQ